MLTDDVTGLGAGSQRGVSKDRMWQVGKLDTYNSSLSLQSCYLLVVTGDVSSSSSTSDSNSVSSHSRVTSAIGVGSGSVGASLSSPGMGNPFARATPQGTWGSTESCEQRPILAPSRLSSHTDSGVLTT